MNIETLAWQIARKAFKEKVDKGGAPYIEHMNSVIEYMCPTENGCQEHDEELNCIAILHDLIEDCPEWNLEALSAIFPERVVCAIDVLTKKNGQTYDQYISLIANNKDAIRVKMADLKDNMDITRLNSIGPEDTNRLRKYLEAYKKLSFFLKCSKI